MSLLPDNAYRSVPVKPLPGDPLGYSRSTGDDGEVAKTALDIADRIRDHDPQRIADQVVALAWARPGLATQILMTLAIWLPIETMAGPDLARQARNVAMGRNHAA